jgi:hypothetical protein
MKPKPIQAGKSQPKATKVFVVTGEYDWESSTDILGVCSSRLIAETAVQAVKAAMKVSPSAFPYDRIDIYECTLDRVSL